MKSKDIQFLHKYAIHFLCFTIQNSPIHESDQIPVFLVLSDPSADAQGEKHGRVTDEEFVRPPTKHEQC